MSEPFAHTSGPADAKIVLVGEAWGEQEDLVKRPFVGYSGQELTRLLNEVGIERSKCLLTNVLALRPPNNNLDLLCGSKSEVGKDYPYQHIKLGKYLRNDFLSEIDRLRSELTAFPRNLVIALGNTACWALLGSARIGSLRGVVASGVPGVAPGLKVLPTYHPAAILRQWSYRPIVLADLMKAKREAEFPEIRRPERTVYIRPNLDDIDEWHTNMSGCPPAAIAADIETGAGQIKCIGFAISRSNAIVIPFVDLSHPSGNYWPTESEELEAWSYVRAILEYPANKVFQNGLYDLQFLTRMGLRPKYCYEDTMLRHHAEFPEMLKGLGFLGSIYTNESSWKLIRHTEMTKRDE